MPATCTTQRPTLNIYGCGHVGKVLGRLWHQASTFELGCIINSSMASGQGAVDFIGAGTACDLAHAAPAQTWLIGVPDGAIADVARELAASGLLRAGDIVFHCSGALASGVLSAVQQTGASIASIHPIKSFANINKAVADFSGTWCGVEGDASALAQLLPAFQQLGAQTVEIAPDQKSVYHAAAVFASNYLVTTIDLALQSYERAGIPRDTALRLIAPLIHGTVNNVLATSPEQALSGPIARNDAKTVLTQYRALKKWNRDVAAAYRAFIRPTRRIADLRKRGK